MHSPLLASLLQHLRPGDEGLLAITLPLPFSSVSSMLTILTEGNNLDPLGEAAQLLLGSAPSHHTSNEINPKKFQRVTEIEEGERASETNNIMSSAFVSTKVAVVEDRTRGMLPKGHRTDGERDQSTNSFSVEQTMLKETPTKSECSVYATEAFSRNHEINQSATEIKSESVPSGDVATVDKSKWSNEEILRHIDTIDIVIDSDENDKLHNLGGAAGPGSVTPDLATPDLVTPDFVTPGLVTLDLVTPGLLFQDYPSMVASLNEWSRANFSPMMKRSSVVFRKGKRPSHTFCCPHKSANRRSRGSGIRRTRTNVIEYVDCPFLIDTKVNVDGSCVVTRALTEHSGHPISEEQFQKYRR